MTSSPMQAAPVESGTRQWRIGSLLLLQGWQARRTGARASAELLIPTEQTLHLRQGNLDTLLRPPGDLVLLPPAQAELDTSAFQGWRLLLDLERLGQQACVLSEHRLSPGRCRRRLAAAQVVQARQSPQRQLMASLLAMLTLAETLPESTDACTELLGVDELIERCIVLLLLGDLVLSSRSRPQAERGNKSRIVEELQGWILANLHRPIQLEELVQQSGYSQRSLRSIFHERFGCGPVQWIRLQRLAQARDRLLDPAGQESVSSVAMACGYGHLSQFSRDFRAVYGLRPSDLLREGRRGLEG